MAEHDQDKSHAATPHKLKEAQKRGQVAKSQEAAFGAILAALVCVCYAAGPSIGKQELSLARYAFNHAGRGDWSVDAVTHWILQLFGAALYALAPLLLAVAVAAVAANVMQVGGIFSVEPLKPDFNKLNPAAGFKRMFSMRVLYDALRSVLKLAALSATLWIAFSHMLPDLLKLSFIDPHAHAAIALGQIAPLLFKLLMVFILIALIDLVYTRWDFAKKMRMSHRELTDEHKQREGDPRIRRRLRQLRAEFLKQARGARKLPDSDVLITNPTHLAVALSYRHGEMPAPKLLTKGSGILAAKMRATARKHNIPIVENPPLTRALYKRTDHDEFVPEDLYPQVAKILLWVYTLRNLRHPAGRTTDAARPA